MWAVFCVGCGHRVFVERVKSGKLYVDFLLSKKKKKPPLDGGVPDEDLLDQRPTEDGDRVCFVIYPLHISSGTTNLVLNPSSS